MDRGRIAAPRRVERDPQAAWTGWSIELLASRHYGERWGRHWLDVARYADSDGYESDADRPRPTTFATS